MTANALIENRSNQLRAEPADGTANGSSDPGPIPEELLHIPGFIDDVMNFTLRTAPYPERSLAFGGALALQSLLAGRKVRDTTGIRTNLYILNLANSGAGKERPRQVNQEVLCGIGMSNCLGDMFASAEGIEDRLLLQPAMLFQTDEIDSLMTKIKSGHDARHKAIMTVLLKMYTSSSSRYPMRVKASKDLGNIDQPSLCIFGTAIPKQFYEALSMQMLSNGFLARMLILEAGNRNSGQDPIVVDLPEAVLATARWWAKFRPGESHGDTANWHPVPRVVEHMPDAKILVRDYREWTECKYLLAQENADEAGMAIWTRANEKACRLALIYACSANHLAPVITREAVLWACWFVEHQTRRMLFMAAEHVSETGFESRCKALVTTLRRWRENHGDAWMPFWEISRRHPWSDSEHRGVRTTLWNQRRIEYQETRTSGRPSRQYRLLASS